MKKVWFVILIMLLCATTACTATLETLSIENPQPQAVISDERDAPQQESLLDIPVMDEQDDEETLTIPEGEAPQQSEDERFSAPTETVNEENEAAPVLESAADDTNQTVSEDWYNAAGTGVSAEDIEAFARKVRDSVLSSDWNTFAQMLYYPITIGETTYWDSETFLASDPEHYFSDEWKAAIEAESCHEMSASWRGIMMGNGEIWINGVINDGTAPILVTAINP